MASITNGATGNGYPYPCTFTLDWWVSSTSGNTHTISWSVTITGGANNYCQSYWNGLAGVNINGGGWQWLWGTGASDTSCAGSYSASCGQGHVVASGSFNVSGGASLQFVVGGGFYSSSNYAEKYSDAWVAPVTYTDPTGLSVSVAQKYTNGAKFNVSISSYGNPSGENGRYIEAAILGQNSYGANYRYATAARTTSSAITVNNSSNQGGTLTIKSNTRYYYGAYATNTQRPVSKVQGQFYTLPGTPTARNFTVLTSTSASFDVTETSEGTGQITQLQYQYGPHGGTASQWSDWQNAGATGNKQTRTVTLTGLTPGTSYDVIVRTLAGTSDYSAMSKYQNAFTVLNPTAVITGATYTYDSATDKCICTFTYNISAVGSVAETYTVNYKVTASDSTTTTGSFTTTSTSGTFQLTLPRGVDYTVETWVGSNGEKSTFTFTSPDFTPTIAFKNMQKDVRGKLIQGIAYGSMGLNAGTDQANVLTLTTQVYNAETNAWENSGGATTTKPNVSESYSWPISYLRTGSTPSTKHPPKYAKLKFIVTATNKFGLSTTKEIVVKMPPFIWGKVITAGGEKLNIVGTMIKDKNGNLTDGRYYEPVKIK